MLLEIGFNNGVPITEDFFVEKISGKHNEDIGPILFPDWDHEKAMKWMDDKETMFRRLASEQLTAVPGLHKLCKWVEDRGLKRAAVTNAPRPNAELMISKLGLKDFFHLRGRERVQESQTISRSLLGRSQGTQGISRAHVYL
ncbi:haloacid dehalogenase-like hydrolase domain-containing protein Sgpp [Iris pallida]|uniref:Haloacid dehalogenase-like hydrolase domain-containing protein Sgpp n=1 Tax=Iris pallida TaxID=29817 RepID=A0AAX6H1I7_IRIPA|nr:haloacid dehalogenase-like hydrolase domain-containing protein Sgpp [Iris pallida]